MSLKLTACCLASVLAWTSLATAQSSVLLPSKTNTLIQVSASSGSAQLSNALGDIYVGRTGQDGPGPATISIRRGLVDFDIADSIPAGATITAVALTMDNVQEPSGNGNQTVELCRMLVNWGQGTSYFNGGAGTAATNGDATWYYRFFNAGNPFGQSRLVGARRAGRR